MKGPLPFIILYPFCSIYDDYVQSYPLFPSNNEDDDVDGIEVWWEYPVIMHGSPREEHTRRRKRKKMAHSENMYKKEHSTLFKWNEWTRSTLWAITSNKLLIRFEDIIQILLELKGQIKITQLLAILILHKSNVYFQKHLSPITKK